MATRCRCILTLGRGLLASLSYTFLSLMASTVYGQFTTVINSPPSIIGESQSIGSDTQLNVFEGGSVGSRFSAGALDVVSNNVEVNVFGGSVGDRFRALEGSQVTISGGEFRLDGVLVEGLESVGATLALDIPDRALLSGVLADGTPFAFSSQDDNSFWPGSLTLESSALPPVGPPLITASTDPVPLGIRQGQTLVVDAGGVVGNRFNAGWGSTVIIEEGGIMGENLEAVRTEVTISGGSVGDRFDASAGSQVNLIGTEFFLDASELEGLIVGEPFTVTDRDVTLSGLLPDGSLFSFELNSSFSNTSDFFSPDATLTVTLIPKPSCILLGIAAILLTGGFVRKRTIR